MASIFNVKTRFLVIDIETTLQEKIFDVSFAVYSRKEGKCGSAGYKIAEHEGEMFYKADYNKYAYETENFPRVMAIMAGIIRKYKIEYATAYNSGFDFEKIKEACEKYQIANPLENLKEIDLYHLACQTLGKQKWFKEFVDKNELKTEKGNRKSNAETMYAYMILNPEYKEEHTGLGDIEIEIQILDRVLRQKKKMSIERNKRSWELVQG